MQYPKDYFSKSQQTPSHFPPTHRHLPMPYLFICRETSTIFLAHKDCRNSSSHHLVFTHWRCCSWRHCPGSGKLARHPPFQHLGWEGMAPGPHLWSGCSCRTQPAMSGPAALAQQWTECPTPHQNLAPVLVLPWCQWGWQAAGSQWQLQERWDLVQQGDKTKIRERGAEVHCLRFVYFKSHLVPRFARKVCKSDSFIFMSLIFKREPTWKLKQQSSLPVYWSSKIIKTQLWCHAKTAEKYIWFGYK